LIKKDVKSKLTAVKLQDLCRNAVDHNKNIDNDDRGHKHFYLMFVAWIIIIKNFKAINSIPAQALAAMQF